MTPFPQDRSDTVYDLVGVGFGPSNLALSAAVAEEEQAGASIERVFLERSDSFGWHRGMLIEDATMQVSFLKDLVTPRNPTSGFGFIPYLWAKGRLSAFINHKTLFPTRIEFHDYLEWVAAQLAETTVYSAEVVNVRPVVHDGAVTHLDVVAREGGSTPSVRRTRNLVLAPGLRPSMPGDVEPSARVWHSSSLLTRTAELDRDGDLRFVVVGAGQSAAEVVAHLHDTFRRAHVHAVFGRYGYSPSDDSPFANGIFDPTAVDDYFQAPADVKERFFDYHSNTNYSVVDVDLLDALYGRVYRERVTGKQRLFMHRMSALAEYDAGPDRVDLAVDFLPTGHRTSLRADHLVFATGYVPVDPESILGEASRLCERDRSGRFRVERDYRMMTRPGTQCGIYLQGGTEHTHGISSSLLSNVAVRAGEILASIQRRSRSASERLTATAEVTRTW